MDQLFTLRNVILVLAFSMCVVSSFAQTSQTAPVTIDVVSEEDLTPGVLRALPEWEKVQEKAVHIKTADELKKLFGDRGVLDLIEFKGGNDAATADYDAGKLLIVEFASPQVSFDTDNAIKERIAAKQLNSFVYRRIGNYNVFLFEPKDEQSAAKLLDQIKYQKLVRWLGEDPFYYNRAERHFVTNTLQLFLTTLLMIGLIFGTVLGLGVFAGILYFRYTRKRLDEITAFSDAGGMIRLNLDEMTPDIPIDRLLEK